MASKWAHRRLRSGRITVLNVTFTVDDRGVLVEPEVDERVEAVLASLPANYYRVPEPKPAPATAPTENLKAPAPQPDDGEGPGDDEADDELDDAPSTTTDINTPRRRGRPRRK